MNEPTVSPSTKNSWIPPKPHAWWPTRLAVFFAAVTLVLIVWESPWVPSLARTLPASMRDSYLALWPAPAVTVTVTFVLALIGLFRPPRRWAAISLVAAIVLAIAWVAEIFMMIPND